MLSNVILVLLVVIFIITFVVPLAKAKNTEGFDSGNGYQSYMRDYLTDRKKMINTGDRQYNYLGASLDPILPTFAVAPSDIDNNFHLTTNQYLQQFNKLTDAANNVIKQALSNPDIAPSATSPTNLGPRPEGVKAQLPAANDVLIQARQCEADLQGRASCSKLKDPKYRGCGICIDGGTRFNGQSPNSFIGGLLSLAADRSQQEYDANGDAPAYQPSLGSCPPGMFYVDADSCTKAVNQLNCKEIGDSGGFQGGRTKEGLQMPAVNCAQAPVQNVFIYQPSGRKFDVTLRCLSPFGTGITQVIATHVPTNKTFKADNNGNPGQEFTLQIRGVQEEDQVNIMVVQEVPHRPNGKAEVFQVVELDSNGNAKSQDQNSAKAICTRMGSIVATKAQVNSANNNGLQSQYCGYVSDQQQGVVAVQSGINGLFGVGAPQQIGTCSTAVGTWCYGFRPANTINNKLPSSVVPFFQSFGNKAQPAQGPSTVSQYSDASSNSPPGLSERAILIQWEMTGSNNRTVAFQPTVTQVNGYKATNTLRLLGPFASSSLITGPAWSSKFTMQKNQFWFWSNAPTSQTATFTALVPAFLGDPYYSDDVQKAPIGPLISNPASVQLLKTSPCFADGQAPGSYSASCLLELFQGAGGDPAKGYLATQNGGLTQLNSYGDLSSISNYLDDLYVTATTGKDGNGNVISQDMNTRIAAMNDAALKLFGFKITNPCEDIVDNADGSVGLIAKPMGNVTPDCLQYLWLNNENDQDRSPNAPQPGGLFTSTYTTIADRFSGLRYNESTPNRRKQYPFQACQVTGTMAPIKNGQPDMAVVGKLSSMNSLQAVQDYFNGIQRMANYAGPSDSKAQAVAMQQCYGINQIKRSSLGYGCTLISPSDVKPGITCYVNLGDPSDGNNYLNYSSGAAFFGGGSDTPNIQFYLAPALNGQAGCISFMTLDVTPLYLRHSGFRIWAQQNDGSNLFFQDASWKILPSLNNDSSMVSFQSVNYPDHYLSQSGGKKEAWSTVFARTTPDANSKSFTIIGVPGKPMTPNITVNGSYTTKVVDGITYYIVTGNSTISSDRAVSLTYFAVGGGGSAAGACGGGAGGLQTNSSSYVFSSQKGPDLNLQAGASYNITIGQGGNTVKSIRPTGTILSGPGASINALPGTDAGWTSWYGPASGVGGCGGGGSQSLGLQGGSTSGANGAPIGNAGAGIGGNIVSYTQQGPGISYIGNMYGVGGEGDIAYNKLVDGPPNTGNGGAGGGSLGPPSGRMPPVASGGSGVFIFSVKALLPDKK